MIAGLCAGCGHARLNKTRRGPTYLRCQLAGVDAAYPRYPRLPVLRCAGYRPAEEPAGQQDAGQQDAGQQDVGQQG